MSKNEIAVRSISAQKGTELSVNDATLGKRSHIFKAPEDIEGATFA